MVIDTLKRIRPQVSGKRNMYDDDYEALQPYVPIANKHNEPSSATPLKSAVGPSRSF